MVHLATSQLATQPTSQPADSGDTHGSATTGVVDDDDNGDGEPNGDDIDVDGDGLLNGDDDDIDGDGQLNEDDLDPNGLFNDEDLYLEKQWEWLDAELKEESDKQFDEFLEELRRKDRRP